MTLNKGRMSNSPILKTFYLTIKMDIETISDIVQGCVLLLFTRSKSHYEQCQYFCPGELVFLQY